METVSQSSYFNGRVYPRKFDHDQARALYATGDWTLQGLASRFGVSVAAVWRAVVDPARRAATDRASAAQRFTALCDDCGGPCVHNWASKDGRHDRVVCRACSNVRVREEALLGRMNTDADVYCGKCQRHRPLERFGDDHGYPRSHCRDCESAARKANREANRERERAWTRERRRRARLEAPS